MADHLGFEREAVSRRDLRREAQGRHHHVLNAAATIVVDKHGRACRASVPDVRVATVGVHTKASDCWSGGGACLELPGSADAARLPGCWWRNGAGGRGLLWCWKMAGMAHGGVADVAAESMLCPAMGCWGAGTASRTASRFVFSQPISDPFGPVRIAVVCNKDGVFCVLGAGPNGLRIRLRDCSDARVFGVDVHRRRPP